MALAIQKLKEKDRAFSLVALQYNRKKSLELVAYLPQARSQELRNSLEQDLQKPKADLEALIRDGLEELMGKGLESLFFHCDPSWISELFKGESPEILAWVLQQVPKARLGGVLKDLPKETRKSLKMISFHELSPWIRELIKEKAWARFPKVNMRNLQSDPLMALLMEKSLKQLYDLLRELGIQEMALAFSKVHRSGIRALLARLNLPDARELRRRIKEGLNPSLQEQREAQLNILSMEIEKLEPEAIVQEIGFGVLSQAFGKEHVEATQYLIYRFPPQQGYILKRYLDLRLSNNTPEKFVSVRQKVLSACDQMAKVN